jgi:hypothetical protein
VYSVLLFLLDVCFFFLIYIIKVDASLDYVNEVIIPVKCCVPPYICEFRCCLLFVELHRPNFQVNVVVGDYYPEVFSWFLALKWMGP